MENKYDNEFVRKQLYDIFGKPKGISYEGFADELATMIDEFNKQSIDIDNFKKEYNEKHKLCPKCGAEEYTTTLMAFVVDMDKKESYKDLNDCICRMCKDVHTFHERIPKIKI